MAKKFLEKFKAKEKPPVPTTQSEHHHVSTAQSEQHHVSTAQPEHQIHPAPHPTTGSEHHPILMRQSGHLHVPTSQSEHHPISMVSSGHQAHPAPHPTVSSGHHTAPTVSSEHQVHPVPHSTVSSGHHSISIVSSGHHTNGQELIALLEQQKFGEATKLSYARIDDVNYVDADGNSALHLAAKYGQANIVSNLLILEATPHLKNRFGETPLSLAPKDDPEISKLIITEIGLYISLDASEKDHKFPSFAPKSPSSSAPKSSPSSETSTTTTSSHLSRSLGSSGGYLQLGGDGEDSDSEMLGEDEES